MRQPSKRENVRARARTCRLQCGRRFDATKDFNSQVCPDCAPILAAALRAASAPEAVFGHMEARPRPVRTRRLIKYIKQCRTEFEAAVRLGADRETLQSILGLGWNSAP